MSAAGGLSWRALAAGLITMAASLWLLSLWLPGWLSPTPGRAPGATGQADAAAQSDVRRIHAVLFYVADSGDLLVGVDREVPYATSPAAQARAIVDAQLGPAPEGRISPVPAGVTVRSLFLTGRGEAFVDLSGVIRTAHPGGSLHEALTVYAIVHALTVNLPDITAVQILIDGREVDTLAGHIDLRHPLRRAPRWMVE